MHKIINVNTGYVIGLIESPNFVRYNKTNGCYVLYDGQPLATGPSHSDGCSPVFFV